MALKLLKSQDLLKNLPMMGNETLTCYILGVRGRSCLNYASLRGNELGAKFVSKPNHHDMVTIIVGLSEDCEASEVIEIVTQYANLLKFSDLEKAALRSICKWSADCLQLLERMLSTYERYQTADSDLKMMKQSNAKLQKGEKLIMPMQLFKKLAKLPQNHFRENVESILSGNLSVKTLVSEYTVTEERRRKEAKIEAVAGHVSIVSLRKTFPAKFTNEIIDRLPIKKAGPGQAGAGLAIEAYTKSIVKSEESGEGDKSVALDIIDYKQDVKEVQGFFKQSKRPKVKEALGALLKSFQDTLALLEKSDKDPYNFDGHEEPGGTGKPGEDIEIGDIVEEKIVEQKEK